MDILANIASIATIILFIFYFIGRIIIILKEKDLVYETIDLIYANDDEVFNKYKIVDNISLDKNDFEYMIITPDDKSYNWVKIFEYSDYLKGKKFCKYHRKNTLNKRHSLKIRVNIAETIPKYLVVFQRSDYVLGSFLVVHNGKSGVQEEMIKCRHTLKSIVYYLLK